MTEFKDKFIAFIDILGFKKLVADSESGTGIALPKLLKLLDAFGTGCERERFEEHGPAWYPAASYVDRNLDFRITQVSDCAIVSTEVSPAGAINLVAHCWGVIIELLWNGIMCRGYINRGRIYHTEKHLLGTGYQSTYDAEGAVSAFKREANERGTPFVEVAPALTEYIAQCSDTCVKEMFSRCVKSTGTTVALFPFQRLSHSFIVAGHGHRFDPDKERRSNQTLRTMLHALKQRVEAHVDAKNERAVQKCAHYIAALDAQLEVCNRTDEVIENLGSPFPAARRHV